MLNFMGSLKIYLARSPVDLRKSFNGLYALSVNVLKQKPEEGGLFVYTNRRFNRIKILYFDGTGLWVMTKRLEEGQFSWPKGVEGSDTTLVLTPEALGLLLDGIDLRGAQMRPWYQRDK